MSKRKVVAGGYDGSSEESDVEALKKSKSTRYVPPRLVPAHKAFQFPGSRSSSGRGSVPPRHVSVSSSNRPTPAPESVQTVSHTPEIRVSPDPVPVPERKDNDATQRGSHMASSQRSTLALERQINDMTDTLEKHTAASAQRQKATDDTLAQILATLDRLTSAANSATLQTPGPSPSTSATPPITTAYLSNPTPTPELIAVVSKVVSEARGRVGKKKGGADDNSCKEHVRNSFYRMLGITASKEIRPYFEDEYGEPDTLPTQFVDPDTRYCRPYPHWKCPLTKQVAWVPTFLLRVRSTIPKDDSDVSNMLRNLSDEQIVTLLNDGPFKSAQTAWRDMKRTDVEIEAMRSSARRYQRVDRKVAARTAYIKTIPSLQGPQWEYLTHPGYMSPDESDNNGGMITKRPDHRAQWVSNLYDAIYVAEREKARAKPGLCPRPPLRRTETVKHSIPTLEHGSGSGKVPVRIAVCGVSKSWRHKNSDDFKRYAHLLDMKQADKPDIAPFLEQHPESNLRKELDGDQDQTGDVRLNAEEDATSVGAGGDETIDFDGWPVADYDGDEESGAVLEIPNLLYEDTPVGATGEQEVVGSDSQGGFPIDPALPTDSICDPGNQSGPETKLPQTSNQGALRAPYVPRFALLEGLAQTYAAQQPDHFPGANMPPPPPLEDPTPTTSQAIGEAILPVAKEKKAGSGKGDSVGNHTQGTSSGGAVPTGKRRGRPPGSKNKPKAK